MLSPLLFNLYLEEALKSKELLWKAASSQRLMAYADDLVIQGKDLGEIEKLVIELETLDGDWNLTVNHAKSEILAISETDKGPVKGIR